MVALMVVLCACASAPQTAAAQTRAPQAAVAQTQATQTPSENPAQKPVDFLPRSVFHMSAEHLSGDDVMFVWDTNFGGELDVVDYRTGRATFAANYQAILGDEFRHFDPNQGNYILVGSASLRAMRVEMAGVFYHQSRHLADRANSVPVAWNMMGGRVQRAFTVDKVNVDLRSDVRGVVQKSFVDYSWEIDSGVRTDMQIRPGIGVFGMGDLRLLGVDGSQNRGNQTGFRLEGGLRAKGRAGAMEFFLAAERRIDPYPLEFGTASWLTVGFRLLSQ